MKIIKQNPMKIEIKKHTRLDLFTQIKEIISNNNTLLNIDKKHILNYLDTEIRTINKRKITDRKREEQRLEFYATARQEILEDILTEEFQSCDAIATQMEYDENTKKKTSMILGELVAQGIVEREEKVIKKHQVSFYRLKGGNSK